MALVITVFFLSSCSTVCRIHTKNCSVLFCRRCNQYGLAFIWRIQFLSFTVPEYSWKTNVFISLTRVGMAEARISFRNLFPLLTARGLSLN